MQNTLTTRWDLGKNYCGKSNNTMHVMNATIMSLALNYLL